MSMLNCNCRFSCVSQLHPTIEPFIHMSPHQLLSITGSSQLPFLSTTPHEVPLFLSYLLSCACAYATCGAYKRMYYYDAYLINADING